MLALSSRLTRIEDRANTAPEDTASKDLIPLHGVPANTIALEFLQAVLGEQSLPLNLTQQLRTYLDYICIQAERLPKMELNEFLVDTSEAQDVVPLHGVFTMLKGIAQCANTSVHFGIDKAIGHLINSGVIRSKSANPATRDKLRDIVYIMISWICMLYSTTPLAPPYRLQMDDSQCSQLNTVYRDSEAAEHSICELIQQFGPLLPVKSPPQEQGTGDESGALYVSFLNASTLHSVGNLNIKWINNVSAHLAFDREKRLLLVFGLPSFCHIHRHDGTTFHRIISGYYDQYSRPDNFSGQNLLREIRLSYRLLFGEDKRAHSFFHHSARERQICLGLLDPYLDELSHRPSNHSTSSTYSVGSDFPILAPRLIELQQYIKHQNPGTLAMLWRDRRDMLRWYTFWVVTVVGGITIIIGFVGIALSAAQVYYTIPSHTT